MSTDAPAAERSVPDSSIPPAPLPDLHQTLFELLRIEINQHDHMSSGVVSRDKRHVLFVVHGETGQLADIGLTVADDAYWFTWATEDGDGRTIGTTEKPAEIARLIVRVLAEGGQLE